MDAGERLALASVLINLVVTGLKYFLGVFSGSLTLLAECRAFQRRRGFVSFHLGRNQALAPQNQTVSLWPL